MFTNVGLRLFAMWEQNPALKQRIDRIAVGTLTDEQAAEAYTGDEENLRGIYEVFNVDSVSVDPNDNTVARVRATFAPSADSPLCGQTIREVGLFSSELDFPKLVWIDKFPATYIPDPASEPDIQGSLVITIPIKFNNGEAVSVFTDNQAMALQSDLDTTNANLAALELAVSGEIEAANTRITKLETAFVPLYTHDVESGEFSDSDVVYCAEFEPNGTFSEYLSASAYSGMSVRPDFSGGKLCKLGDKEGNCAFSKLGRVNFSGFSNNLGGSTDLILHFDWCTRIFEENHSTWSILGGTGAPRAEYFVVCEKGGKYYFIVSYAYLDTIMPGETKPVPAAGFYIPLEYK